MKTPCYYIPRCNPAPGHNACCSNLKSAPAQPVQEQHHYPHSGLHAQLKQPATQHYYVSQARASSGGICGHNSGSNNNNIWWGRTEAEVKLDNDIAAAKKKAPAQPNPPVLERYWVREVNGQWVGKSRTEIDAQCQPGQWYRNPQDGSLFFCRTNK